MKYIWISIVKIFASVVVFTFNLPYLIVTSIVLSIVWVLVYTWDFKIGKKWNFDCYTGTYTEHLKRLYKDVYNSIIKAHKIVSYD